MLATGAERARRLDGGQGEICAISIHETKANAAGQAATSPPPPPPTPQCPAQERGGWEEVVTMGRQR